MMCVPFAETLVSEHCPAGSASNAVGKVVGSSAQRVWATPEPPSPSAALTDTPTGAVYQPFDPFGAPGLSVIVVIGSCTSYAPASHTFSGASGLGKPRSSV